VCRTLSDRLNRTSRRGEVTSSEYPGCFCIDEEISACPLVSVVIPSAGKDAVIRGKVTDLLANCVTSIDERTDYENFELIVVDNDDLRPRTREIAERCGCELVHFREPFNVARKMNLGARRAQGEYLLFLNDDIETIDATWLRHMLQIAQRDGIGVVGAKLLFEDGTLQHVGVTFDDDGLPGHVLRGYPGQHPGYFFSNCSPRNYLAVTGACMLTRRELFEQVGGFNERFAVNFNDVDYCLRCHEAGYRIVFAPRARLYHFESRTREPTVAAEEVDLFKQLWADITKADPYYSRLMDNKPPKFLPRVMDGPLHSARRASGTAKGLAKDASAQKQSA
jgi:GT2 family glycosyltransferase